MKKYIILLIFIALLLPNTLVKAQSNKNLEVISISDDDYNIKFIVFNPSDDSDVMYSGLPLKKYHIIPTRLYNGKSVSGNVYWSNPEYIIVDGYQVVDVIFDCIENNEIITLQVNVFGINNTETEDKIIKNKENIVQQQIVNGGIRVLDKMFNGIIGCTINDIFSNDDFIFKDENDNIIEGNMIFENFNNTKVGIQEIKWIFTPNDLRYETKVGYREIKLIKQEILEEPTTPSLTATKVLLNTKTTYDINLNDKVSGSTYLWTTTDTEIIEVNPKNGYIKAISEGKAIVTCEITLPDGNKEILESEVIIGFDENAPILTETILDLEVGDKFDINLENKVSKSKYRWTSSNRDIIKVNSANGKISAVGVGEAYVICIITTPEPENQVIVLRCDINVTDK